MDPGAAQPVQAGVDHDAMQPAADGRVVAKRGGAAVRGEHGVLQGVVGVFGAARRPPGQPVQVAVVAADQLCERIPIAGDVGGQQVGVAAGGTGHGRTVLTGAGLRTSPAV